MNDDDRTRDDLEDPAFSGWSGFVYLSELKPHSNNLLDDTHRSWQKPGSCLKGDIVSLSSRRSGDRVRIVALNCGAANNRLMGMGLIPGAVLEVISCTATGSAIVAIQDRRLGLAAEMVQKIQVIDANQPLGKSPSPSPSSSITNRATMQTPPKVSTIKLRDVAIGTTLRVIGYEPTARDYKRKLLAMGLTPGTELRVTRHAPLGDPTEISVRGFQLSLRKTEADALIVEPVTGS